MPRLFPTLLPKRELSEKEFGRLFHKCRKPFIIVANSYIHNQVAAEDLVNDSFVKLWEKRSEIQTENFEAYLFQIVIRKCLDYLKSESSKTKIKENIYQNTSRMISYEINSLLGCDPSYIYTGEIERLFRECINNMPKQTREIFLASRMMDKTYREIAEEHGLTVRQVTSEMQSALASLRHAMKDYLPLLLIFNHLL